ncbi:MAG: ferredoxin domain-containing protein [Prevotellaceae bacterium]|jgi:uncharacterized ferredoxin-like protein|nr:ferredoxin domain-containing protein [Prevotellaceae bacterium]
MLITENESRRDAVRAAAQQMLAAARTAPKGKGLDTLALGLLGADVPVAFGIPLSCSSKSPFFDRK